MSNAKEFIWTEKYRPQKISECILPKRIEKILSSYVKNKTIPNVILSGPPGVGKTTAALAMCSEIGLSYLFINSSSERGIDVLRTVIVNYASTVSLKGGHKVIILDEADGLTKDAQDALRGAIQQFSKNCSFILTCNNSLKLAEALHSRCPIIDFTLRTPEKPKMASLLSKRLTKILEQESVKYDPTVLTEVIKKYFPDYRRILGELQKYASEGNIDSGVLAEINSMQDLSDLCALLKTKEYSKVRKWVAEKSDADSVKVYRLLYDELKNMLVPESIPQAVVTLAKYQYQAAFVADQEINFMACLTEIMVDCDFK